LPPRSTAYPKTIFVTGKAGLGKTTVVDAFLAQGVTQPHMLRELAEALEALGR